MDYNADDPDDPFYGMGQNPCAMPPQVAVHYHAHAPDYTKAMQMAVAWADQMGCEEPDISLDHRWAHNPNNGKRASYYEVDVAVHLQPGQNLKLQKPAPQPQGTPQ